MLRLSVSYKTLLRMAGLLLLLYGLFLVVSIGLCMLALSTLRPRLAYWSLQLELAVGPLAGQYVLLV